MGIQDNICLYHDGRRHILVNWDQIDSHIGINWKRSRLTKRDILRALDAVGLSKYEILKDEVHHPGGPAFSLIATKQ